MPTQQELQEADHLLRELQLDSPESAILARDELRKILEKRKCEGSLAEFVKCAWLFLEPETPLKWNWHLDTMCGYLEAIFYRDYYNKEYFYTVGNKTVPARINKADGIIINVPPGSMKSTIVSVCFEAWIWTIAPGYSFLCGANESSLATRDAVKMRQLVESDWYQGHWGEACGYISPDERIFIDKEQGEKLMFANSKRGFRTSQGIGAKVTGKRARMLLMDDPHDANTTESDVQRTTIIESWDNGWHNRIANPVTGPRVIIMQRLHYKDLSGHLADGEDSDWIKLAIPMRYDEEVTFNAGKDIGRPDLNDPRWDEGELMFPERFPEEVVKKDEIRFGSYVAAGQLQQRPSPKSGGEMKRDWLQFYKRDPVGGNNYILVDPAGERKPGVKGKRDNTAMGVVSLCSDGNYYLVDGRRERLNLTERTDLLFRWHRKYRPLGVGYEQYGMQSDIAHIKDKMEDEGYRFKIIELGGSLAKEDRIRRLLPLLQAGKIWLPETLYRTNHEGLTRDLIDDFIELEYLPFPVGTVDDFLDMLSRITDPDFKMATPDAKSRRNGKIRNVEYNSPM